MMMSINQLTHEWAKQVGLTSYFYPEITSTNDVAKKEFIGSGLSQAVYLADHQTAGRGRNQNNWQNMAGGEILLSSWCFRTQTSPQPIFTPLVGLAVYKALKSLNPEFKLRLKAPNDIILEGSKLAGILVEVTQQGPDFFICVGLGLNVFDAPQVDVPTTFLKKAGTTFNEKIWNHFCDELLEGLEKALRLGQDKELDDNERLQLLTALNAELPPEEQYQKISPQCDLYTATGIISWMDL